MNLFEVNHYSEAVAIKTIIITCMHCGVSYNPEDPLQWPHVCPHKINPDKKIEDLERRVVELERKQSGCVSVLPDITCPSEKQKSLVKEEPHPYLCVHHGGSPACEDSNKKYGFVCPKCVEE